MDLSTALLWSWLNILTKKRYDALVQVYGSLDEASGHIDAEMLKGLSCREDTIFKTLARLEEFDAERYQQELQKRSIGLISLADRDYPGRLLTVDDAPVFLHFQGSLDLLEQPCLALVGTRNMSPYGQRVTEGYAAAAVQAGFATVSGLALGIDTVVARETLQNSGRTAAVLAQGLARISPQSNARLAAEIVENGGCVLTEFSLDQFPDKYAYPARNRIIAALSLATVVIEAPEGSGALITADLAFGYGRDVFAVPGQVFDPNYLGCHQAIAKGQAKLAVSPEHVLRDLGAVSPKESGRAYEPEDPVARTLWKHLSQMPVSASDLIEKTGKPAATVSAQLTTMELDGAVKNIGGNQWVKC